MGLIKSAELCKSIKDFLKSEISKSSKKPRLKIYTTNLDPASVIYVGMKKKTCEEVGISCDVIEMNEGFDLKTELQKDYELKRTDGVLVQKPTLKGFDDEWVHPTLDVDGFHPINQGKLFLGEENTLSPCTPLGVMFWLKNLTETRGLHAAIIGRSAIVGRPMASLCLKEGMAVSILHRDSKNNEAIAKSADVVIAAVGVPGLVTEKYIKPGAIVMDVGINRVAEKKIVGDVDQESVVKIAKHLSAVPGGVGPLTVTMVLWNTCRCSGMKLPTLKEFWSK